MTMLHCRAAADADIAAIQAVAEASWLATYDGIFSERFIRDWLAKWYATDVLERCCTDPGYIFLVATDDDTVVAFGLLGFQGAGPELYRLYAQPDRWRGGVGTVILDHLEELLRARGVPSYSCHVHRANDVGAAFYARRGFVHQPDGDDDDHHFLVRTLVAAPEPETP